MKNIGKFLLFIVPGILLASMAFSTQAQPGITSRNQLKANLTEEQKSILAANRSSMEETRRAFKASLTREQLEMLKDNSLSMEQKRANLRATMSPQQKQMLGESRQMRMMQKQSFRHSITMQQKQYMRKAYINRMGKYGTRPGLRRIERFRR